MTLLAQDHVLTLIRLLISVLLQWSAVVQFQWAAWAANLCAACALMNCSVPTVFTHRALCNSLITLLIVGIVIASGLPSPVLLASGLLGQGTTDEALHNRHGLPY